ncbi:MAG: YcxB family protein [Capsulimonadales bacterium]|nr:YcxB family protein [Capsulimonadales bacterium]
MKLRFSNTIDDIVALSDYNHEQSPTLRRARQRYRLTGAILASLLSFLLLTILLEPLSLSPLVLLLPLLYAAIFAWKSSRQYRRSVQEMVRQLYSEPGNRRLFTEHELEVVPEGLIVRTKYQETRLAWGAFERIEATADHTFLFIGSTTAYVLPNGRLNAGDLQQFLEAFRTYYVPDATLPPRATVPVPTPPVVRPPVVSPPETVTVVHGTKPWYLSDKS